MKIKKIHSINYWFHLKKISSKFDVKYSYYIYSTVDWFHVIIIFLRFLSLGRNQWNGRYLIRSVLLLTQDYSSCFIGCTVKWKRNLGTQCLINMLYNFSAGLLMLHCEYSCDMQHLLERQLHFNLSLRVISCDFLERSTIHDSIIFANLH